MGRGYSHRQFPGRPRINPIILSRNPQPGFLGFDSRKKSHFDPQDTLRPSGPFNREFQSGPPPPWKKTQPTKEELYKQWAYLLTKSQCIALIKKYLPHIQEIAKQTFKQADEFCELPRIRQTVFLEFYERDLAILPATEIDELVGRLTKWEWVTSRKDFELLAIVKYLTPDDPLAKESIFHSNRIKLETLQDSAMLAIGEKELPGEDQLAEVVRRAESMDSAKLAHEPAPIPYGRTPREHFVQPPARPGSRFGQAPKPYGRSMILPQPDGRPVIPQPVPSNTIIPTHPPFPQNGPSGPKGKPIEKRFEHPIRYTMTNVQRNTAAEQFPERLFPQNPVMPVRIMQHNPHVPQHHMNPPLRKAYGRPIILPQSVPPHLGGPPQRPPDPNPNQRPPTIKPTVPFQFKPLGY